jgi:hypothetical protein
MIASNAMDGGRQVCPAAEPFHTALWKTLRSKALRQMHIATKVPRSHTACTRTEAEIKGATLMGKMGSGFDANGYATVAERIRLFYSAHSLGRIETQLIERTEREVVFKAVVYRGPNDEFAAATGWASERVGDGEINIVACLENTETSAVGRALANLGFTASRERPSAEEMAKASRARAHLEAAPTQPSPSGEDSARTGDGLPVTADSALARDLLNLIDRAALLGVRVARIGRWRTIIVAGAIPRADLLRCERRLRVWIERHRNVPLMRAP